MALASYPCQSSGPLLSSHSLHLFCVLDGSHHNSVGWIRLLLLFPPCIICGADQPFKFDVRCCWHLSEQRVWFVPPCYFTSKQRVTWFELSYSTSWAEMYGGICTTWSILQFVSLMIISVASDLSDLEISAHQTRYVLSYPCPVAASPADRLATPPERIKIIESTGEFGRREQITVQPVRSVSSQVRITRSKLTWCLTK
jgi:hypothetical protein